MVLWFWKKITLFLEKAEIRGGKGSAQTQRARAETSRDRMGWWRGEIREGGWVRALQKPETEGVAAQSALGVRSVTPGC